MSALQSLNAEWNVSRGVWNGMGPAGSSRGLLEDDSRRADTGGGAPVGWPGGTGGCTAVCGTQHHGWGPLLPVERSTWTRGFGCPYRDSHELISTLGGIRHVHKPTTRNVHKVCVPKVIVSVRPGGTGEEVRAQLDSML